MFVLVDGKEVEVKNDVKIIHDGLPYWSDEFDCDSEASLHLVFNCEGLVSDLFDSNTGDALDTMSATYDELSDMLF